MEPTTNNSDANKELPTAPPTDGGPEFASPVVGGYDRPLSAPTPKSRSLKALLIALVAVLVIGGASAAAYFGVILPNKPINVLKIALSNSLQQGQSSFKGTLETNPAAGGVAYKADFSGATDTAAKAADLQLNLTASGVTFPVETRLVNQNAYVKVGDLSMIAGLANAYSPGIGGLVTSLSNQLSNKWVVIDSTLLKQSGAGCYLDANWGLNKADINLLNNVYDKNSFITIQNTGTDSVNGQKAEKFVLSVDNDKLAAYGNDKTLNNLSVVKAAQKCNKNALQKISNTKGDHGKTPLTVWVDKSSKRIVKISETGTSAKNGFNGTFTLTIGYNKVSITAPANAEPAMQVLPAIQKATTADPALANLLSGGGTTAQ